MLCNSVLLSNSFIDLCDDKLKFNTSIGIVVKECISLIVISEYNSFFLSGSFCAKNSKYSTLFSRPIMILSLSGLKSCQYSCICIYVRNILNEKIGNY